MKFIVFSGLDGAGKSTQIDLLQSCFEKIGKRSFIFWSRGGYTPGFQFLKKLLRIIIGKQLPKPGFNNKRKKAFSNHLVRRIWLSIAILDLIFFYSIFLRLKLFFGYYIICDRYIIDTEIDFKLNFPNENVDNWILWKILKYTALNPDFNFILLISPEESILRSIKKNEPFPDSKKILRQRLKKYNNYIISDSKYYLIESDKTVESINKNIEDIINYKN